MEGAEYSGSGEGPLWTQCTQEFKARRNALLSISKGKRNKTRSRAGAERDTVLLGQQQGGFARQKSNCCYCDCMIESDCNFV